MDVWSKQAMLPMDDQYVNFTVMALECSIVLVAAQSAFCFFFLSCFFVWIELQTASQGFAIFFKFEHSTRKKTICNDTQLSFTTLQLTSYHTRDAQNHSRRYYYTRSSSWVVRGLWTLLIQWIPSKFYFFYSSVHLCSPSCKIHVILSILIYSYCFFIGRRHLFSLNE